MRLFHSVFGVILFLIIFLFTSSTSVYASDHCDDDTETDIGIACISNDPAEFVGQFYGIGLGLIGGIAVLFIIIGGFFILTSEGDSMRLATGKSYITYAVIGLLLAIFGYIFITVIVGDILRVPGFESS